MVEFQQTAHSLPAENRAITRVRIGSVLREDQQVVPSITGCHTTGGRIGFANNYSGIPTNVNFLTINSWNPTGGGGSGAFDITEATDNFTIDGSGNGNNTLASDSNGNQVYDGSQFYTYDGWNRLITVSHGYRDTSGNLQHGQASVTNNYDAKGRRITKVVNNTGSWDCAYNYYYNKDQQIEQQNGSNETIRQNVWGLGYIDNLIQTSLNSSPMTQSTCDTPYWVLQDANYNVLGILNSSGVLVERYEYSAYGQRTVYFSPGSNDPFCMAPTVSSQRFVASTGTEAYGLCEFGHQGLMHDEECGLVYDRNRMLDVAMGRMNQRDSLLYVDGLNLYQDVRSNPTGATDPTGKDRYLTGGVASGNPFSHSTIAIDDWKLENGKWVKTGVRNYELIVGGMCCTSPSAAVQNPVTSRFNGFFSALSSVGPSFGLGTVEESDGLPNTTSIQVIPSSPEDDIATINALNKLVGTTAVYHIWFNNCHEWAKRHQNDGLKK